MDLETAVASVVAAEGTVDTPSEALKALAVAARSYFVAGKGRHRDFDFCDTTHCQFLREPPASNSAATQAVSATRGLVITYQSAYQSQPIAAMYTRSCSGRTRDSRRTRPASRRLSVLFSRVQLLPPAPIAMGESTLGCGCRNPPQLQRVFASAPRPPLRLERRPEQ